MTEVLSARGRMYWFYRDWASAACRHYRYAQDDEARTVWSEEARGAFHLAAKFRRETPEK